MITPRNMIDVAIGELLTALRQESELSVVQMAAAIGVGSQDLAAMEAGDQRISRPALKRVYGLFERSAEQAVD